MLIETTKGLMDTDELELRSPVHEDEDHIATATEYWLDGELVHRSCHVHMKRLPTWELAPILQQLVG